MSLDYGKIDEIVAPQTKVEENRETLAALGATVKIGNVELPPVTTAVLCDLDLVESPFIKEDAKEFTLWNIYEAVYIIVAREKALAPISKAIKAKELAEKTLHIAEARPEFYAAYLRSLPELIAGWTELDNEIRKMGYKIGVISIPDSVAILTKYLNDCQGGFAMIPSDGMADKKKDLELTK